MRSSRNPIDAIQRTCAILGAVGVVASAICLCFDSHRFYEAWLFSWFYWFSLAVGCLGYFMIYRLTGGEWGKSLERILISGGRTFEILLVLFLPLLGSFEALYRWAHADLVSADPHLLHKHSYLNIPFWCGRAAGYFAAWIALSWLLTRADKENARRLSAFGLILLFLTVSFASFDWIMSLEPIWYSTIYGLIIMMGQGLAGLSFALLAMHVVKETNPVWNPPFTSKVLKDQGNILLTTSILWTYCSFVQWLIIWIGNIPETVSWYVPRATGTWAAIAWAIFIGEFLIPFQLLLWQSFKEKTRNLAALGVFLLISHFVELYWLIDPALHPNDFKFNWMIIATWIAIGGIWLAWFLRQLKTLSLASPGNAYTPQLRELIHA